MKKLTLAASLLLAPAFVQAQTSGKAQSQASIDAAASANSSKKVEGSATTNSSTSASAHSGHALSTEAQSKVDANLRVAREKKLPEEPIRRRVAEGQAKGASEAQIVAASGRTLVDLQSSFDAMVSGGHSAPSDDEVARGAQLKARGYTSAQLEGIARKAPSDRSLVVAFETLASLQTHGMTTSQAVLRLESLLAARASDAQLRGVGANGNGSAAVAGGLNVGGGERNAAGNASGSAAGAGSAGAATGGVAGSAAAGAGAAAAGALGGVKGGVTGKVGGVLGKP